MLLTASSSQRLRTNFVPWEGQEGWLILLIMNYTIQPWYNCRHFLLAQSKVPFIWREVVLPPTRIRWKRARKLKVQLLRNAFCKGCRLCSGGWKFSERMTLAQYLISRDKMFHSQLAFLMTCSMLFLQVKCSNLLFRLLISRATFTTGLENQLEVNFARARRS